MGFPNETELKPYLLKRFASAWYDRMIRDGESYERGLPSILQGLPELGMHTSVLAAYWTHMKVVKVQKGIWCQKFRAPYGVQFQKAFCHDCHSLNSYRFKRNVETKKLIVACSHQQLKGCKDQTIALDGVYLKTPLGSAEGKGEWYIYDYTWSKVESTFSCEVNEN